MNCCTLDWFDQWEEEALEAVGQQYSEDFDIPLELRGSLVDLAVQCHMDARSIARDFLRMTGRHTYVTPMNFTELLSLFQHLFETKRLKLNHSIERLRRGIEKIEAGGSQIGEMQKELLDLKPQLERATAETADLLMALSGDKMVVEEKRRQVDQEVVVANAAAKDAEGIRIECETRLAEAMPILEAAIRALDTIKPADIRIIQTFKNPPKVIKVILEGVVVMLDIPPMITSDPNDNLKKIVEYWPSAQRMIIDPHFIDRLKQFDKDSIPPRIVQRLRDEYIVQEEFDPDKAARASSAAEGLCKWVLAIVQ